jgi:HTH-type transcriptional repressor of NAD biosynthesis genes
VSPDSRWERDPCTVSQGEAQAQAGAAVLEPLGRPGSPALQSPPAGPAALAGPTVRRLCLLGGESSGKTTLAQALARELHAPCVAEYGRELWLRLGGTFDEARLLEVAREQVRREEEALEQARLAARRRASAGAWVVCDTSALTTLVYSLLDHGGAGAELGALARRPYDLTVLCALDFGFVQDGARRDAGFSARQQALTVKLLREFGMPWVAASGDVAQRMNAVRAALAQVRHSEPGSGRP